MPIIKLGFLTSATLAFLLACAGEIYCSEVEVGTFSVTDLVACRLVDRPGGSSGDDRVSRVKIEFRTSHASNTAALIGLQNDNNERLSVVVVSDSHLSVRLAWRPADDDNNDREYSNDDDHYYDFANELATLDLTLNTVGVGAGEWHQLDVNLSSGGSVNLDGNLVGRLPNNFTASFAWNSSAQVLVGGGFRGCIANASFDGVANIPLHSESRLLNRTDSVAVNSSASRLPGGGSGCRQESCLCLPNGMCVYQRWNVLLGCNCSRGYEGEWCGSEMDTCLNLEPGRQCLNGGGCENEPGPQAYRCRCTPVGQYVGSQCQSFNHCRNPITCQNGANCSLSGDPETPTNLDYTCACTPGFTGKNCTVTTAQPDNGVNTPLIVGVTVGVIAVLLLLIAALVAIKVIRERRRDSGMYKPSRREESTRNSVYADQAVIGMTQVMRPPKDERFI